MAAGVRLLGAVLLAGHAASFAPVEIGSFAPAPTPSADIENLTARNFEEKVLRPANSSAYLALVLFHADESYALELFKSAKTRLDSGVRNREYTLFRPVRFFIMDCTNQASEEICRQHVSRFPSLVCFRGQYTQRFTRDSWHEESVSYWVGRASRPAYVMVETMEQWLAQESQAVPCFLLVMKKADPQLLLRYQALALELMEFQNFHVALDDGKGDEWKDLPGTRPSIHFIASKELNLEAPPFELAFDQEALRSWVIISSLPPVRFRMNFHMWELIPIGWSVVVLRHHGDQQAVEQFQERAQAMLEALRFSFAHLDVSTDAGNHFARTFFPLLASYWEDYIPFFTNVQAPRIFVFTKTQSDDALYWDSVMIDFPSPDEFQLDDVEKLMRTSFALRPGDFSNYWLGLMCRYERFGARSWYHRLMWFVTPFISFYLILYLILWFYFFVREIQESELFQSQVQAPEKIRVTHHAKSKKGKKTR